MALFHLHLKQIGRKTKQGRSKSAAAVVAYRERAKIAEFDYRERGGFLRSYTLIPPEFEGTELAEILSAPDGFAIETEKAEKRKDSQLWDELEISLQKELSLDENIEILNKLISETYTVRNQPARVFIHQPPETDNIHAHVLIIQRPLEKAPNGSIQLGKKIRQEFARGKPKSSEIVDLMRSRWADLCNTKFAEKGLNISISHESLKNQHENALAAGDLVKAAETDRPPLYLSKSSRKAVTEVIVTNSGDYDFEANRTHLANTLKAKDLNSLTIDFWVKSVQFWANAKKIKTNFRLARRKQKQKIQKIITENLINVQNYAIESISTRLDRTHRTISNLVSAAKSNVDRLAVANRSNSLSKITKSIKQFASGEPNNGFNSGVSNDRSSILENEQRISNRDDFNSTSVVNRTIGKTTTNTTTASTNNYIKPRTSYASANTTITIDELNREIEKQQQLKYTPRPRRRI